MIDEKRHGRKLLSFHFRSALILARLVMLIPVKFDEILRVLTRKFRAINRQWRMVYI